MKSNDFGKTWELLHEDVQSFGVEGKFLYVSVSVPGVSDLQLYLSVKIMESFIGNEGFTFDC